MTAHSFHFSKSLLLRIVIAGAFFCIAHAGHTQLNPGSVAVLDSLQRDKNPYPEVPAIFPHVGTQWLREYHAGISFRISNRVFLGLEGGYQMDFGGPKYVGGFRPIDALTRGLGREGWLFRLAFQWWHWHDPGKYRSIEMEFGTLGSGLLIRDAGLWGGSCESDFASFFDDYRQVGIFYSTHYPITKRNRAYMFLRLGLMLRGTHRQYVEEGQACSARPSTRTEDLITGGISLQLGFDYRIYRRRR